MMMETKYLIITYGDFGVKEDNYDENDQSSQAIPSHKMLKAYRWGQKKTHREVQSNHKSLSPRYNKDIATENNSHI